jgi:hypothetical protein
MSAGMRKTARSYQPAGRGRNGFRQGSSLPRGWSSGAVEISARVRCLSSDGSPEERVKGDRPGSSRDCLSFPGEPLRSRATQPAIRAFAVWLAKRQLPDSGRGKEKAVSSGRRTDPVEPPEEFSGRATFVTESKRVQARCFMIVRWMTAGEWVSTRSSRLRQTDQPPFFRGGPSGEERPQIDRPLPGDGNHCLLAGGGTATASSARGGRVSGASSGRPSPQPGT